MADPTRREILELLIAGPLNVGSIADAVDVHQYVVSKHLAVLLKANIVEVKADGKLRIYSIVPELRAGIQRSERLDFGWGEFSVKSFFSTRGKASGGSGNGAFEK